MEINTYKAILHSLVKTEMEWNTINTVIPANQLVYAVVSQEENILNYYVKIGDGIHNFVELPKGNLTIGEIREIIDEINLSIETRVEKTEESNRVYGTDEFGNQTTYSIDSFGHVDDVLVNGNSVVVDKIANIDLTGKVDHFDVMPTPSEEYNNIAVQYIGATTNDFIHGYFYECNITEELISDISYTCNSSTITVESIDKEVFEAFVNPTSSMSLTFVYDSEQSSWLLEEEPIIPENYGIVFGAGTPYNEDTIIIDYTPAETNYGWVEVELQNSVSRTTLPLQVYGTDESGNPTTFDFDSFGHVDDVKVDGVSVVDNNKIANIDLSGKVDHFEVLPEIIEEMNGLIVQYIGDESSANGYFYKAHYDSENPENSYWEQVNVQPVVDNLLSHSTTNALSANMGRELQEEIEVLQARGRYLSVWNCETGLPETNPLYSPYEYRSGDYFIVGTVGTTNYKPNGSQYVTNVASTTVETEEVAVNDTYIYDGSQWTLQSTGIREFSFANITGDPYDNTNLATALNAKVSDVQVNGTTIVVDNVANIELEASDIEYTNEQYPSMQTIQDAMDRLLYITPTVSITGGGTYEIGATRTTTTLNWSWNKTIVSQSLNQGIGSLDPTLRTYTYNTPITSNTTFTISGTDGTTPKSASTTVSFSPKRYWGVSANTSLTDADILALSQELSTSRTQTRTFDCSGGKYFYFVIRTDYCSGISFKVNGLAFTDMDLETRNVVNAQGYTASYNIYRVHNIQTGSGIEVQVL